MQTKDKSYLLGFSALILNSKSDSNKLIIPNTSPYHNISQNELDVMSNVIIAYGLISGDSCESMYDLDQNLIISFTPTNVFTPSTLDERALGQRLSLLFNGAFSISEDSHKHFFKSVKKLHKILKKSNALLLEDRLTYILAVVPKADRKRILNTLHKLLEYSYA